MGKTNAKQRGGMDEPQAAQPAGSANRVRGARPGNTNALKHGFYSAQFTKQEISRLDGQSVQEGLQDQINMLRVLIRRAFNTLDRHSPTYHNDLLNLLETCTEAISSLNEGAKTQRLLGQKGSDPAAEFNEIIKGMMNEPNASQ